MADAEELAGWLAEVLAEQCSRYLAPTDRSSTHANIERCEQCRSEAFPNLTLSLAKCPACPGHTSPPNRNPAGHPRARTQLCVPCLTLCLLNNVARCGRARVAAGRSGSNGAYSRITIQHMKTLHPPPVIIRGEQFWVWLTFCNKVIYLCHTGYAPALKAISVGCSFATHAGRRLRQQTCTAREEPTCQDVSGMGRLSCRQRAGCRTSSLLNNNVAAGRSGSNGPSRHRRITSKHPKKAPAPLL